MSLSPDFRENWFDQDSECRFIIPREAIRDCFSFDPVLNFVAWRQAKSVVLGLELQQRSAENFIMAGDCFVSGVLKTGFLRRRKKSKGLSK